MCGSFLIVEGSRSDVEAFADADPYRVAGLFRTTSIDEWVWAVSRVHSSVEIARYVCSYRLCTEVKLSSVCVLELLLVGHKQNILPSAQMRQDIRHEYADLCILGVQIHPPDASSSGSAVAGRMFSLLRCTDLPGSLALRQVSAPK